MARGYLAISLHDIVLVDADGVDLKYPINVEVAKTRKSLMEVRRYPDDPFRAADGASDRKAC